MEAGRKSSSFPLPCIQYEVQRVGVEISPLYLL